MCILLSNTCLCISTFVYIYMCVWLIERREEGLGNHKIYIFYEKTTTSTCNTWCLKRVQDKSAWKESDSARSLGFILDSKLSMKKHIIKICQTAYFKLKRISSIRRFLTEDATKTLVTSFILSRLDYCNCLLIGTPNSVIQPLQKIQNFAARLVLLAPRHHHATPLLEKLHWLPISERIKYKVACMCFSAINGSGPAYLSELLHVYTPSRTLRSSSDTRMLEIQQYKRKTHGFCTFSCFGPHIWNSLPQDLRHCATLSSFKAKLKTFLFSQYFHPN